VVPVGRAPLAAVSSEASPHLAPPLPPPHLAERRLEVFYWLTNTGVSASRLYWKYKGGFFNA
jgi:hypothetical protein